MQSAECQLELPKDLEGVTNESRTTVSHAKKNSHTSSAGFR